MDFSDALRALKDHKKVMRKGWGWNNRKMFVYLVDGGQYRVQMPAVREYADNHNSVTYEPYLALKNIFNTINTWTPSSSDLLATDWEVIE